MIDELDISDLIGDDDSIQEEAVESLSVEKKSDKIGSDQETPKDIIKRLERWNKSCRDILIDLRSVNFYANDEDMYLTFKDKSVYSKPIYFKKNPENPKDPSIQHPEKQFCKVLGVPHKYFMDSRPTMKTNMFRLHQASFGKDDGEKAQYMARIRESQDYSVLRALLPMNHSLIQNNELMGIVSKSVDPDYIDFVHGDERDELVFHARCILKKDYEFYGNDVRAGFSVVASELGAGPLMLEVLVYDPVSKTSYVASYGGDSFFKSDYKGIQPSDIKDLFALMLNRISDEFSELMEQINKSKKQVVPEEEAYMVSSWKKLPPKFKKALFHEACECADDMSTNWDFARHMSLIAKDFESKKRLIIEKAAGRYLNLVFPKN